MLVTHSTATFSPRRIAIIGGGLSGLAAAHRLIELTSASSPISPRCEITLLETGPRLGGIVGTKHLGGYLIDTGADSFLTNKPGAIGLCRRLGIEDKLIATDPRYRGVHVVFDRRPVPVPAGFQLLSPTAIWPMLTTPILSPWGKLRLLLEPFVPSRTARDATELTDESLASFVRRRFGREVLERLVQPLVGGIYTSDPDQLSLAATLPRFLEQERDFGSLIRAARSAKSNESARGAKSRPAKAHDQTSSGARYGLFAGLAGGMEDLLAALRSRVEAGCMVKLNTRVTSVQSPFTNLQRERGRSHVQPPDSLAHVAGYLADDEADAQSNRYRLTLSDGTHHSFDTVIVATTTHHAAMMLDELDPDLSCELQQIEYASSAIVVTGHRLADVAHPLDSFGLVVPHRERRRILATSFSSRKFPERAPAGSVLLRTFVGGAMQPELNDLPDDELLRLVQSELNELLGVRAEPEIALVVRYPRAMPQYHVGHLDRVARIEVLTARHSGLALAGNAYRGVGIPDAIQSGEAAAECTLAVKNV